MMKMGEGLQLQGSTDASLIVNSDISKTKDMSYELHRTKHKEILRILGQSLAVPVLTQQLYLRQKSDKKKIQVNNYLNRKIHRIIITTERIGTLKTI